MTRMTGPDSMVMCNLIIIHTYIHIRIYIDINSILKAGVGNDRSTAVGP